MWQRLQTLFLGLAALVMVVAIFLPLWRHVDPVSNIRYELYPLHFSIIDGDVRNTAYFPYCVTAILMIAAATVAVMTIRRYDDRLTQMKLGGLNSLLLVGVVIASVYFSYRLSDQYGAYGVSRLALWVNFSAVAFNWIALRFIKRDEKIVRDSERLR